MKVLLALLLSTSLYANVNLDKKSQLPSLVKTYQREIAFLMAQKRNLEKRLNTIEDDYAAKTKKVKSQIKSNQDKLVSLTRSNEILDQKLLEAERNLESKDEQNSLLETTLHQGMTSLDIKIDEKSPLGERIDFLFQNALKSLTHQTEVRVVREKYFDREGKLIDGDVVRFGHIARFSKVNNELGLLLPVGEGRFKMTGETTSLTALKTNGSSLPLFLYESDQKGMEIKKEKSFMDTLAAGGSIAYVIALMGVIAMVMVFIRYVLLQRAGKVDETELSKACESLSGEDLNGNYAVSRVVKKILNNKEVDREAREDIINESILSEISLIDKFGTMILVMAAVAPLLGLLGTVTGMISTFDIITEFGTGDPKMLSSGISEALITTKLGLMVAIPTLLLGNMLGSKASKIKLTLECEAMKFANLIETKKELA